MPNGNGVGKLYRNRNTGETIRWSGTKPPTREDLELAAAQNKYNKIIQEKNKAKAAQPPTQPYTDFGWNMPTVKEFGHQVAQNLPTDVKNVTAGLGGLITGFPEMLHSMITEQSVPEAFTQPRPEMSNLEAAKQVPILGSAIRAAEPTVRTLGGYPGAVQSIPGSQQGLGELAGMAAFGKVAKPIAGIESQVESKAATGLDVKPPSQVWNPRTGTFEAPASDIAAVPKVQAPSAQMPLFPEQAPTPFAPPPEVMAPQVQAPIAPTPELAPQVAAPPITTPSPITSQVPELAIPPEQFPTTLPPEVQAPEAAYRPQALEPRRIDYGAPTGPVRPPSMPEALNAPLPAVEAPVVSGEPPISPEITPEISAELREPEIVAKTARGELLRQRAALKKSPEITPTQEVAPTKLTKEVTKLPPGPESEELGFDFQEEPKSKLRQSVERLWSEEEGSLKIPAFQAKWGTQNQTLRRAGYHKFAQVGEEATDAKGVFISRTLEAFDKALQGLSNKEAKQSFEILNKYPEPSKAFGQFPDKVVKSAIKQRVLTEKIHSMFPEKITKYGPMGGKYEQAVGHIDAYITHMQKMASGDSLISQAFNEAWDQAKLTRQDLRDFFTHQEAKPEEVGGRVIDPLTKKFGTPQSPYTKTRFGKITDLEKNPYRIWPTYVHSAGKVIFDLPAVNKMKTMLGELPQGVTREAGETYIKSIAGYVDDPATTRLWNRTLGALGRTAARSTLGFSPQLQEVHIGRLVSVYGRAGSKYFFRGLHDFVMNPAESIKTARRAGLMPQSETPWSMKLPSQKLDSILFLKDAGNALVRSVGYNAFLRAALDKGLTGQEAMLDAIARVKEADQFVDAARTVPMFQGPIAHEAMRYKYVPWKMTEQYMRVLSDWKTNPWQLARFMTGTILINYLAHKTGLRLFHLDPRNFYEFSVPLLKSVKDVIQPLAKGDVDTAISNAVAFPIPAGKQAQKGFPMFEKNKDEDNPYQN